MKSLYEDIREQIEDNTSVTFVRLWNNQIQLSEDGQQIPFPFPACFIDFPLIEWAQRGKGTQNSDLTIRIHICFESFHTDKNEEDLALFDLREEVYLALQDFKPTNAGKLLRISEQTDTRHSNIYHWIMDFTTTYMDSVAQYPRGGVTAEIETLTINKDLIIDAGTVDGIRTDFEFPV